MRRSDPTYVTGPAPFRIQPPIVHPAFCVCRRCTALRFEERGTEHTFRILRKSKYPASESQSIIYAAEVKALLERALREAIAGGGRREPMHLRQVCDLYFEQNPRKVSAATIARDRVNAENVCRLVGELTLPDQIDEPVAVRYRNAREKEGGAPRTILDELFFLKKVLRFALRWERETGMTALRLYELPGVANWTPDAVALTRDEFAALLAAAGERERRLLITGVTTMLRRRPLLAQRHGWLDLERRWLSVPADWMKKGRAKHRYPLEVPLAQWTADTLADAKPTRDGYYWTYARTGEPLRNPIRVLEPLYRKAKVRAFSLHDLRTTGATWLREAKVDELAIAILLGHQASFDAGSDTFHPRGGSVTRSYTKLFEPTLRQALEVFEAIRLDLKA